MSPTYTRTPAEKLPTDAFTGVVAEALVAFAQDASYSVEMAGRARTILHKRETWANRRELRAAEQDAHRRCRTEGPDTCGLPDICGTGACPFAPANLRQLRVPPTGSRSKGRGSTRPRPGTDGLHGTYHLEHAVTALTAAREAAAARPSRSGDGATQPM